MDIVHVLTNFVEEGNFALEKLHIQFKFLPGEKEFIYSLRAKQTKIPTDILTFSPLENHT